MADAAGAPGGTSTVDIFTGGDFSTAQDGGTGRMLTADNEILVISKSVTERDLTITLKNGKTVKIPILPSGGAFIVRGSWGAQTLSLSATDAGVFWALGPRGTFFLG